MASARLERVKRVPTRGCALLLIALLALVSVGSFVHTDDGCQVEIHCLACRLALGTRVGTALPAVEVASHFTDSDPPASYQQPPFAEAGTPPQPYRGPPLT
jgi:hypothetical protein